MLGEWKEFESWSNGVVKSKTESLLRYEVFSLSLSKLKVASFPLMEMDISETRYKHTNENGEWFYEDVCF